MTISDEAISSIARAYLQGRTTEEIAAACRENDWNEEDIFLAVKAGEILSQTIAQKDEEKRNRKPMFKRVDK